MWGHHRLDVTRDVIGLYREGDLVEIAVLHVRAGRLWDVMTVSVKDAEIPDESNYNPTAENILRAQAAVEAKVEALGGRVVATGRYVPELDFISLMAEDPDGFLVEVVQRS